MRANGYMPRSEALAIFHAAGIELQNSKPDSGPRRWFAGPSLPTIRGDRELTLVAAYLKLSGADGRVNDVTRSEGPGSDKENSNADS